MPTHPFAPVVDDACHTLILGSFPSVKSRADGFYYAHPQNRFWRMLSSIYDEPLPDTIAEKTQLLLRHHLALWDVISSCEIEGSSDASVRQVIPVPITQITETACITRVLCNGKLAGSLYQTHLQPILRIEPHILPSTSPANASWTLPRLMECWRPALLDI